ncbi:MAG: pitrilysin family protein [Candidatus Gastranaerophilales bacterium]|nr:pitrilysin family protein [Candidatus Gastranaerophilales bacterium]
MEKIKKTSVEYPFLQKPVVIYERECGHKIVCAYKEGGLTNVSTWVKTGSINEDEKINGISHFLEHLMFKGTKKHKAGYFDKTLESKGGIVNAATWKDYTFYYVTIPKGPDNEYFNTALDLHSDMMLNPQIPDCEVGEPFDIENPSVMKKRERHVVIEEIRMRQDQPWTKVYNSANSNMYTSHPYKRDVIGTAEIISKMPRDTIMEYYMTHYTPNKMTTIIVGDFDFDKVIEQVIEKFDFEGRKNSEIKKYEFDTPTQETKYIENKQNINTAFLMFGYLGVPAVDLKSNIIFDMLSIILGEGQSSRMYQNLIEKSKEQIFNLVSCDYYTFRDGGNFFIQANFKPELKDKALELVKNEIEKLYTDKITDKELKKAVKKLKARFADSAETVSEIAETIGYYMTVCNGLEMVDSYIDTLENITEDDVLEVAKKHLNLDNATISVLLPNE